MKRLALTLAALIAFAVPAVGQQKPVNIGSSANNANGDPPRTAFGKLNDNDADLYARLSTVGRFAPVIDGNGKLSFQRGPTLGTYQNGQFTSQPYKIQIQGPGSTGPVDGMSVGGAALSSGVLPSVLTRLSAAQVADVRSGGATIDLAPVLNVAFNACAPGLPAPTFEFPPGVYGIGAPLVASTCPINIVLDAGATIRVIAPFPLAPTVDSIYGAIQFSGNASGSTLTGSGTIDGNRSNAAILAAYLAGPRSVQSNGLYVMTSLWECVAFGGMNDITVDGITLKGCMTDAIQRSSTGFRAKVRNVRILDSSVAIVANGNAGDTWENITARNIGNVVNGQAIPYFSYAMNFFSQTNLTVNGVTLDGYQVLAYDGTPSSPGTRIGDPQGAVIQFQRLTNGTIRGITGRGINFDTTSDKRRSNAIFGTFCDSCENVTMSDLSFTGTYFGITLFAPRGLSLSNFVIDGQYNTTPATALGVGASSGLAILPTAQLTGQAGLSSAFDHNNMDPGRHVSISNGTVRRSGIGLALYSGNANLSNIETTANLQSGVQIWATARGNSYPNAPLFMPRDLMLDNIRSTYNGACGFQIHDGVDINYSNLVANNNFQDSTTGCAAGVSLTAGFGTKKQRNSFSGWAANDNQSEAITATASFLPGASTSGVYQFIASNSSQLHVGQRILVKNGGGSGTDLNVKVTDITNDNVTVQTQGASTAWSPAACTTSLPGTVSQTAGQYLLNGSGTNFTTSLTGPAYLLAGGQYLRVGAVRSDVLLQMDSTPSPSVSGASASLVGCAIQGIPSQQVGFAAPADPTISDTSLGDPSSWQAVGNTSAPLNVASASIRNDTLSYGPTFAAVGGSGVTLSGGASYKLSGKVLFVRGFVQVNYTSAPTAVSFTLPTGLTAFGGGAIPGFNANTGVSLSGQTNGTNVVTLNPVGGALAGASGQFLQFSGTLQVN